MYVHGGLVGIFPSLWLVILCVLSSVYSQVRCSEVDKTQIEAGREQYECLQSRSQLPQYGKCWTDILLSMQRGCAHLTADMQARLALSYLNCFLQMLGSNRTYFCDDSMNITECMRNLTDSDSSSLANFFTCTQSICYFLQSQKWQEKTQATISRLSQVSDDVAENLAATTELQREALQNQVVILEQAKNFSKTLNEERHVIDNILDIILNIKMMLGEFWGFYSIVYYTLFVLLSYLVTSTPRTSGARFWMFGIVTLNIMVERVIIYWSLGVSDTEVSIFANESLCKLMYVTCINILVIYTQEAAYRWNILCRKVSASLALFVLVIHAVRYRDLNTINNEILREIKAGLFNQCNCISCS